MSDYECFFAHREDAGPCSGQLIRGHLIPRQLLKREFRYGCVYEGGFWWALERGEDQHGLLFRTAEDLIVDERSWVPMCGGPMGNAGHHGQLDCARTLRISREELPELFLEFLTELGLLWYADRNYAKMHALARKAQEGT